jgi:hypothetical protein
VPHARIPRPTVRRVRGERARKDLWKRELLVQEGYGAGNLNVCLLPERHCTIAMRVLRRRALPKVKKNLEVAVAAIRWSYLRTNVHLQRLGQTLANPYPRNLSSLSLLLRSSGIRAKS